MELVFIIGAVAGAFMLLVGLIDPDGFMITPVIIGAALLAGLLIIRHSRVADQRAFESDVSAS